MMWDLLRLQDVAGHILAMEGGPGQGGQRLQQGKLALKMQAQNRHQCQAAGHKHGRGNDVQEGNVQASVSGSWSRAWQR